MRGVKQIKVPGILIILCVIIVFLVAIFSADINLLENKSSSLDLSISSLSKELGYSVSIPAIIYQEPNIEAKCIMGQLAELDNEHITFRASKEVPQGADILGEYTDWEYCKTYLDRDNTSYYLRGNSESDIRLITWTTEDVSYGIKYKTGLDLKKSFSYLGINLETLEVEGVEDTMKDTDEIKNGVYENDYFRLKLPPILGDDPPLVVESESQDGVISFSFNGMFDGIGLKTIFVVYRLNIEDADKIGDYVLPSTDNNVVLLETTEYIYTISHLNVNPFKSGTLEYEAYYTINNQMKAVRESFEVLNS